MSLELRPCGNNVGVDAVPEPEDVSSVRGASSPGLSAVRTVERRSSVRLGMVCSTYPVHARCDCFRSVPMLGTGKFLKG